MSQIGMDHEQHHHDYERAMGNDGWVEINDYTSSQHQSPILNAYDGFNYMHPISTSMSVEPAYTRMAPPPATAQSTHQPLLPLIMPSHPTWPSMLTNPAGYQAPPVAILPVSASLKTTKLPSLHTSSSSPRKTLTDADRRRMCQYHEDHPSVKQTEIGAMFGVERSTVSKVLRQKDKYLFPEDRSLSPVKRAKGKFPDIDRALANWVRNSQKQGVPLTDAAIKEKAKFFATTVGNNESHLKANSTSWLEKFKQKNGIGSAKLLRRASETTASECGSLNLDSAGPSASDTPSGISPSPPSELASPLSLSAPVGDENRKESIDGFFDFGNGHNYQHSNSQSTTSLSSALEDTAASSFSAGPTTPSTPFTFSSDTACTPFMPSQHSRLPPPNNFQRPRSQTFPTLDIDPSYISPPQSSESMTPKFHQPATAPASALNSEDMPPPFGIDSAISSSTAALHRRSSNGSLHRQTRTPVLTSCSTGLASPVQTGSSPTSPSQDDARRALDTLLNFFSSAPQGFDEDAYMTVIKLTERLHLQANSGSASIGSTQQHSGISGLGIITEQDSDINRPKLEHSISASC
ncbi:MAG: hypothetical protein M1818_004613 [Claussenomyces sp. TS43310]|nr:MAG: hypothetical protein M1818_004613 [Claussenomyces sp. TS43310]